jgi:hypothetical protein
MKIGDIVKSLEMERIERRHTVSHATKDHGSNFALHLLSPRKALRT